MRHAIAPAALVALAATLAACQEGPPCHSAKPTLASIQVQIFDVHCATPDCHGASGKAKPEVKPLHLERGKAHASLVGVEAYWQLAPSPAPQRQRVVAGDPDTSFLLEKLTSAQPTPLTPVHDDNGYFNERMPNSNACKDGGQCLCKANVDAIRQWITDGALDN